jgi:hypothetical protein
MPLRSLNLFIYFLAQEQGIQFVSPTLYVLSFIHFGIILLSISLRSYRIHFTLKLVFLFVSYCFLQQAHTKGAISHSIGEHLQFYLVSIRLLVSSIAIRSQTMLCLSSGTQKLLFVNIDNTVGYIVVP